MLNRLPFELQKAVAIAFKNLERNPSSVGFKKLFGKNYSFRVTETGEAYRVIGRLIGNTVHWEFIDTHKAYIAKIQELRRGRKLFEARRVSWKIAGKLMPTEPDPDGEIFLIVELVVTGRFGDYRNPTVQFIAGTKLGDLVDPSDKDPPALPLYRYTVEATFRHFGKSYRDFNMLVMRIFDAKGRLCTSRAPHEKFELAPWLEENVNWNIQEGIWRTLITGNVRDRVANYEPIWREMVPYLLEMSKMTEMAKMENLFWQAAPGHEELHTDTSAYDESRLTEVVAAEEKLFAEVARLRPFLRMPFPNVIRKKYPPEHFELHTDNSASAYDE